MTLGDGVFSSTILVIAFVSIVLLTKHHKWKAVGKWILIVSVLSAMIGIALWAYRKHNDRPQVASSLHDINLGMSELDVTLIMGSAGEITEVKQRDDGYSRVIIYGNSDSYMYVILRGPEKDKMTVTQICDHGGYRGGYENVLGFGMYSSEKEIIKKLGNPSSESVNEEGTAKILTFSEWKAAFEFVKGHVSEACVTNRPSLKYVKEYKGSSAESIEKPWTKYKKNTDDPEIAQ